MGAAQIVPHELSGTLLRWYETHARDLPWRKDLSPYRVLVSEIMLQQTQVTTVIPYFARWLERFPTFNALAQASEEEVLKAWEGLGYYRRARSLHRLARTIQFSHDGKLPSGEKELLDLPGIGPYTAGAILSIAFNRPIPAVDGNVERILTRIYDVALPTDRAPGKRHLRELALNLIPEGKARDLNQALMELGAMICLPRTPLCHICPAEKLCLGRMRGTLTERPVRSAGPKSVPLFSGAIILHRKGRFLIFRRPSQGLMAGLWEFPTITFSALPDAVQMKEAVRTTFDLDIEEIRELFTVRHSFTRYRITLKTFQGGKVRGEPASETGWQTRWADPDELFGLAFSAGSRKIRDRAVSPDGPLLLNRGR